VYYGELLRRGPRIGAASTAVKTRAIATIRDRVVVDVAHYRGIYVGD